MYLMTIAQISSCHSEVAKGLVPSISTYLLAWVHGAGISC
jgi:hypothetical protein